MIPSHLIKSLGLGAVLAGLSAGAAMAAVATTDVNVRSGPGTGYPIVSSLSAGQYAAIVRQSGSWCYVNKAGPDGWVSCAYLTGGGRSHYVPPPDYGPDYYAPQVYLGFGYGYGGGFPHRHHMHPMPPPGGGMPPPHPHRPPYPWPWPPMGGMGPMGPHP